MAVDPAMMARQQQASLQAMLAHQRAGEGGGGDAGGGGGISFVGPYGINFMEVLNAGWLWQMAGFAGLTAAFQGFSMQNTMAGARLPGMGSLMPIEGNTIFGKPGGGKEMARG